MKWKFPQKIKPSSGDRRTFLKFFLFPVKTTDGYWRWLERVTVVQEYGINCWWTVEYIGLD